MGPLHVRPTQLRFDPHESAQLSKWNDEAFESQCPPPGSSQWNGRWSLILTVGALLFLLLWYLGWSSLNVSSVHFPWTWAGSLKVIHILYSVLCTQFMPSCSSSFPVPFSSIPLCFLPGLFGHSASQAIPHFHVERFADGRSTFLTEKWVCELLLQYKIVQVLWAQIYCGLQSLSNVLDILYTDFVAMKSDFFAATAVRNICADLCSCTVVDYTLQPCPVTCLVCTRSVVRHYLKYKQNRRGQCSWQRAVQKLKKAERKS